MSYQVVWRGIVHDRQGYARASREYIFGLDKIGVDIRVEPLNFGTTSTRLLHDQAKRLKELIAKPLAKDKKKILVYHSQPYGVDADAERAKGFDKVIINTVWETTKVPREWFPYINKADGVIVPSNQNVKALRDSGVTVPIYLVPHGAEIGMFNPNNKPFDDQYNDEDVFKFLSVFQWQHRKGPDVLVKAYLEEFSSKDKTTLIIKSYFDQSRKEAQRQVHRTLMQYKANLGYSNDRGTILYTPSDFSDKDIRGLYAMSDIFVLPTRGEGVGLPFIEAMCSGIPSIATGWGGQVDFINDSNGYLIDYELTPTDAKYQERIAEHQFGFFKPDMYWAEPNIEHLKKLMRHAYENQDEVKEKGRKAREDMEKMTWLESGRILKDAIEKVM